MFDTPEPEAGPAAAGTPGIVTVDGQPAAGTPKRSSAAGNPAEEGTPENTTAAGSAMVLDVLVVRPAQEEAEDEATETSASNRSPAAPEQDREVVTTDSPFVAEANVLVLRQVVLSMAQIICSC